MPLPDRQTREPDGEIELFTRKLLVAITFALILCLLWIVRDVLVLIFIAAVIAAGISPAVHRARVMGRYYLQSARSWRICSLRRG